MAAVRQLVIGGHTIMTDDANDSPGVVIVAKIRDPESRSRFRRLVGDWGAQTLTSNVYEITRREWSNWDDFSERDDWWRDELTKVDEYLDSRTDSVFIWWLEEGRLVRATFGAGDIT